MRIRDLLVPDTWPRRSTARAGDARDPKGQRVYGNYFGATFFVDGRRDYPVALLWAQEDGYGRSSRGRLA